MKIIKQKISVEELNTIAAVLFGDMVKGVVDIDQGIFALDAELHSDLQALLLQDGSRPANLWGINLYPKASKEDFLEYDSMINVRPSAGNRSRTVESETTRKKISEVVAKWIAR